MFRNFLKQEKTNNAIMLSMSLSLIAKAVTFIQAMIVTYFFGASKSTDILFYAVSAIALLVMFANVVNQSVFIPNMIYIRNKKSETDSHHFISFIFFIYVFISGIVIAAMTFYPAKTFSLFSQFSADDINENITIIRYIIPTFLFIILNTFLLDVFTSYKYFSLPMLLEIVKSIVVVVCIYAFSSRIKVAGMALGLLSANVLQFMILLLLIFRYLKLSLKPTYYKLEPKMKRNIMFSFLGQSTAFLKNFWGIYLVSGFTAGIYTALNYGQRLNNIIISVVIIQISTVVGINIIELFSANKFRELDLYYRKYFRFSLFIILPVCTLISINSGNIISILFERGEFTSEAVKNTALFLSILVFIVPINLLDTFIVRLIVAKQIQHVTFLWKICNNTLSFFIMWLLIRRFGYIGYPIGMLFTRILYVFSQSLYIHKKHFKAIKSNDIYQFIGLNLLINLISGLAAVILINYISLSQVSKLDKFISILASFSIYLIIYLGISSFIVNKPEMRRIPAVVKQLRNIKMLKRKTAKA